MADEPLCPGPGDWYKDAVLYQVHLKSFADGNGDGMGDFKGLIAKLDYLEDLGVTALWLLPFYPSPMRDDGYDISDYTRVHPDYGTLGDFKRLLREAHKRGLRVITELVLNHTSDQHPWFRKARTAKPGTSAREFYVWSDDPERYPEARVIFRDFERSNWTWDDQAKAYYWHRFYSHQPDLNYDNPRVREAMLRILDFWFELGVDGIRLDAVNYLYEREGTNCENLPENHEFLRQARRHVDERFPGRVLLAESNQWPEDAAKYFGRGDECHMAFHFPLMPRLFMALETENRYPVIDILEQTPSVSEACQWALFLRNHDELTLEMVTDEERDYMYRIYVADPRARVNLGIRRRLAPLLDNDRRKIELMNVLLMTLPGSPIIYYGDEIGMGDNFYLGDRDGVRTPMQWNGDQNAGFSPANPQKLYLPLVIDPVYHYGSLNVDTQEGRRSSLLWWMRHLIALRRNYCCFGRGDIRFLAPDNPKVLAFVRTFQGERVLVAVNLSRHSQSATLELSEFAGHTPRDAFSRNPFPQVGEAPYSLTLTPHGYYILELRAPDEGEAGLEAAELPRLQASTWWGLPEDKRMRRRMEHAVLPRYMRGQRWFGGKARVVRDVSVLEWIHIRRDEQTPIILLVEVSYQEGDPEIYVLPVAFAPKAPGDETYELPRGSMAWLEMEGAEGAVYEAVFSSRFCRDLFRIMAGRKRLSGHSGRLMAASGKLLRTVAKLPEEELDPRLLGAEQSNTSILYGQQLILKLYRRTEKGTHPDVELARFLTEKAGFAHTPPFAGSAEHRREDGGVVMLGLMQGYVPNQGDAWDMTQDMVRRYFERVLTDADSPERPRPGHPASCGRRSSPRRTGCATSSPRWPWTWPNCWAGAPASSTWPWPRTARTRTSPRSPSPACTSAHCTNPCRTRPRNSCASCAASCLPCPGTWPARPRRWRGWKWTCWPGSAASPPAS
ncbi:maltose alpha-D-glucosyltransferase [Desulfohalovibrio reitneri]|uniref:maltose alpha-D-glucosyltransferase n=1 Tax=Desulfohalovibrio reitneri TaxID=1307759 RepID=UPI000A5E907D|nr:maltose alpha-D-glucosyltransferase [Desulfohalovibrio reitneri]